MERERMATTSQAAVGGGEPVGAAGAVTLSFFKMGQEQYFGVN
jgi:hypothetical protein